jgi:hypothetical protein
MRVPAVVERCKGWSSYKPYKNSVPNEERSGSGLGTPMSHVSIKLTYRYASTGRSGDDIMSRVTEGIYGGFKIEKFLHGRFRSISNEWGQRFQRTL